ncbi:hypothetical protein B0A53_04890 [Rhodotorula sp. CCFEE 5036]|nr:hypothetical protein B0A53_04890 [Rhodotorula sp. CCFEE 5036]
MLEPVESLGGAVEHKDTVKISWHFKANLSELPPEGFDLEAPASVPLPGSWRLELTNEEDDPDELDISVTHGRLPVGSFGKSTSIKFHTGYPYTGYSNLVPRSELAASGCWPTSEQNSVQQYRCTLIFERDLQLDTARSHHTPTADVTKALRLANLFRTRRANVCLRFRRLKNASLELWTTSGLLTTASEYYKTLLASGCAEMLPSGSKRKRGKAPPPLEHDFLVERDWSGCKTASRESSDLEYQQIDVRETAYSTMSAREELQQLALDALSTSLTTKCAAGELFGPVSIAYTDVKKVVLDYVVENWQEVQASKSWKEMREKARTGETEGAAQILFDLLSTLQEKDLIRATPQKQTSDPP